MPPIEGTKPPVEALTAVQKLAEPSLVVLTCGCEVRTSRDFLGRVVGTITVRADGCPREDHRPGHTLLMPGREHAGPR